MHLPLVTTAFGREIENAMPVATRGALPSAAGSRALRGLPGGLGASEPGAAQAPRCRALSETCDNTRCEKRTRRHVPSFAQPLRRHAELLGLVSLTCSRIDGPDDRARLRWVADHGGGSALTSALTAANSGANRLGWGRALAVATGRRCPRRVGGRGRGGSARGRMAVGPRARSCRTARTSVAVDGRRANGQDGPLLSSTRAVWEASNESSGRHSAIAFRAACRYVKRNCAFAREALSHVPERSAGLPAKALSAGCVLNPRG